MAFFYCNINQKWSQKLQTKNTIYNLNFNLSILSSVEWTGLTLILHKCCFMKKHNVERWCLVYQKHLSKHCFLDIVLSSLLSFTWFAFYRFDANHILLYSHRLQAQLVLKTIWHMLSPENNCYYCFPFSDQLLTFWDLACNLYIQFDIQI